MYLPTIGLEIHVELSTSTKMFCSCVNNPLEPNPNVNVCPICLGHPGTLPTVNRDAVAAVIQLGLALGGTVATESHFDRKSYFYPDLPKGYQISQYKEPLITGGSLNGVRVRRIHLEEDVGRLGHDTSGRSLVNFNRAGVPLMELVTEPDVKNAEEADSFARELQRILRYLGISNANMERGEMRIEANISVRKNESDAYGTKVEIKNLNSFRVVESAVRFELERQEALLEQGKSVVQETRGWNESAQVTIAQRSKESAHDYRYFPEPDLPPLKPFLLFDIESFRAALPELPEAKRTRFVAEFGLVKEQAELLTETKNFADYFEAAASELAVHRTPAPYTLLANYMLSDVRGIATTHANGDVRSLALLPEHLGHLVSLVDNGTLSSRMAKDLLVQMVKTGEDPETLIGKHNMALVNDVSVLETIVRDVIQEHQNVVADYRSGKKTAIQFLVGQGMKRAKGQADPVKLRELFEYLLI